MRLLKSGQECETLSDKPKTIFEMAKEVISELEQWDGNAIKLIKTQTQNVFLSGNNNGDVFLVYQKLNARGLVAKTHQTRCAYLFWPHGWVFCLTDKEYQAWAVQCKSNEVEPKQAPQGGLLLPESRNWGKNWRR